MSRSSRLFVALSAAVPLFACSSSHGVRYVGPYSAKWVRQQIEAYEKPTDASLSRVTRKVLYSGKSAYLIPSPCCDELDYLYDAKGAILCAPSGGFAGHGDGSCPEILRGATARDL